MCGIVGYVGSRPCRELLLRGLERLEYRGYDSAGVSLLVDGQIESVRAVGNLSFLREAVSAGAGEGAAAGGGAVAQAGPTIRLRPTPRAPHRRRAEGNAPPHLHTPPPVHNLPHRSAAEP